MKKANSLILILIGLTLFSGLTFGYQAQLNESLDNAEIKQQAGQIQLEFKGTPIPPNDSISWSLDWVGDFDGMNFYLSAVSTGNITTANVSSQFMDGTETTTDTLISGTPLVQINSMFQELTIYNYKAATANVIGNFLIWNN